MRMNATPRGSPGKATRSPISSPVCQSHVRSESGILTVATRLASDENAACVRRPPGSIIAPTGLQDAISHTWVFRRLPKNQLLPVGNKYRPLALIARLVRCPGRSSLRTNPLGSAALHTRTDPSRCPIAKHRPCGANSTAFTADAWRKTSPSGLPSAVFQHCTSPRIVPVTKVVPSGLKATLFALPLK